MAKDKSVDKILDNISEWSRKMQDLTDEIQMHMETIESPLIEEKGLIKLKKKQREELLKKAAEERFPEVIKEIRSLNQALEGMTLIVEEIKDNLDQQVDILDDIERLKDEIEDKKRELEM